MVRLNAYGELKLVSEIMNTQRKNGSTKWRDRRNNIAHQAMPFGSESKFHEYRDKILDGVNELEGALSTIKLKKQTM